MLFRPFILLIFLFSLFFSLPNYAQHPSTLSKRQKNKDIQQIEILHADILQYQKELNANRLVGHVLCRHEKTLFYCDTAYLYPDQSLKAIGNIHIVSDSLNIDAQRLFYNASTKVASLEKNVQCFDSQIRLNTEILQYFVSSHIAYYPQKAEIVRKDHHLISDIGYYYASEKTLAFKNNVVLTNPEYVVKTDTLFYYIETDIAHFSAPTIILMDKDYLYCEKGWYDTKNKKAYFSKNTMIYSDNRKIYADSLMYDENKDEGQAYFHVRLIDTSQKILITGHKALYNRVTEKAIVTQHPVLKKIHHQQDTIFLTSDTMIYEKIDSNVYARCINNSKLFHPSFQSICQNIIYSQKDSIIDLIGMPRFWMKKNQANSKTARIYLQNQSVKKIVLDTHVIIMQEADTIYHNKYHQIAGRHVQIFFKNDSIQSIKIEGNAQIYYFIQNDRHQWTGLNKAKCSKIRIDFLQNEIQKIVFIDHPESQLIPIKKIQVEKEKLENFEWQPQLKPTRAMF